MLEKSPLNQLIKAVVAAFDQGGAGVGLGEEARLLLPPLGEEEPGHLVLRQMGDGEIFRAEAALRLPGEGERILFWREGTLEDHALGLAPAFFAQELHGYPPPEPLPARADGTLDPEALRQAHEEAWRPVFEALGPKAARLGLEGFLRYYRLLWEGDRFQDRTFPSGLTVRYMGERLLDAAHPERGSLGERFWHPWGNPEPLKAWL